MMTPLQYLHQRHHDHWLLGSDRDQFYALSQQSLQELQRWLEQGVLPKVLLCHRNPIQFLAGFIAACAAQCPVFLSNPDWGQHEWQQVLTQVQPQVVWGELTFPVPVTPPKDLDQDQSGWIMIPTGGSSGQIRFAIHTWETLLASVVGFRQHFGLEEQPVNSCCVLPLYHVSGLMQFLRSFISGGNLVLLPFKSLSDQHGQTAGQPSLDWGVIAQFDPGNFFLSLVPTQLQQLLSNPEQTPWLSRFATVLLGGAPAWPELLHQARKQQIRLAPTYGMTETASQIATLLPDEFLSGQTGCGAVLPHAQITIDSDRADASPHQPGSMLIQAQSLALGYYPKMFPSLTWRSDDLGYVDAQNHLHVVGRNSRKIITGGENVYPAEVEAAIRATTLVSDVVVLGVPDGHWGERVTAVYVPSAKTSLSQLKSHLQQNLSRFKHPKQWIVVTEIPRNAQGKINYQTLQALVKHQHTTDLTRP